ncbi:MAG: PPK2 family polyphosphate kinase [Actinomycetota bacterium]
MKPGQEVRLDEIDPASADGAPGDRAATEAALPALREEMAGLQDRLWAEGKRSLLVILQAMDAGGKDGTIRHVFKGLAPQATRVTAFKVPNALERSHDFLWRVHLATPARGEIAIFNRSHYEDILVVAVHDLVPELLWRARYSLINSFEELLAHGGTTIVKFFLHISRKEQASRLEDRLADPAKRWKFRREDLEERALWDRYQKAYQDALQATSTSKGPWYVVPADRKWYRNWVVSRILVETLRKMDPQYPVPENLSRITID